MGWVSLRDLLAVSQFELNPSLRHMPCPQNSAAEIRFQER